ncbi:hypothetical protein ElyMa_002459000 [Elysia marginata]|uniref:AMOP domain-containing protein n=1 Tax=Elysia marginata TaxID=1093978 RepID=A0AAV4GLD5_9GAST|nr:hypothetical protein ElyMa_002459000 [Elysia marginata]
MNDQYDDGDDENYDDDDDDDHDDDDDDDDDDDEDVDNYDDAYLNINCNANRPGNVNPEFGANEPGCGNTFSYNGGAGAGTAACACDGAKPYEDGFNDKKRDPNCCSESRVYQRPLVNKKPGDCSTEFKYVPEFNYPPPPCPPQDTVVSTQSGCCKGPAPATIKPAEESCTTTYKYVPEFNYPPPPCPPQDSGCNKQLQNTSCCGNNSASPYQGGLTNKKPDGISGVRPCCNEPDTYESISNTDAQRYKGKGPDRTNFYADDDCGCQKSNNSSSNNNLFDGETDWSEIRKLAYAAVENCSTYSPKLPRRFPSFYCEEENYVKDMALNVRRER